MHEGSLSGVSPKVYVWGVIALTLRVKCMTESQNLYVRDKIMTSRFHRIFVLLFLLGWITPSARAEAGLLDFDIDPDIVCRRLQAPAARTLCPKLEHLRLKLGLNLSEDTQVRLVYDPQHVAKVSWYNSYELGVQRLPSQQTWLDDYAIRTRIDSTWELSIEDWVATTIIPDASGLGFSRTLQDAGWNQTALRLTWLNPDKSVLAASLIVGQGEGERLEEHDRVPYWGGLLRLELAESLALQAGLSYDSASQSPESFFWIDETSRNQAAKGFRTTRQALSLFFDGQHSAARGLRMSLGWQRNRIRGTRPPDPALVIDPAFGALDPTELLAEFLGGKSHLDRSTVVFSASYLILAEYVLAFHYQELSVNLRESLLRSCSSLDESGRCGPDAANRSRLRINALTYGIGKKSDSGWSLMLESFRESYDQLYELYHFAASNTQRQRSLQLLQLRLSWII